MVSTELSREVPERDRASDGTGADWETVADLPASAKLVARVLEHEGALTGTELAAETRLPRRTVRYAVRRLEEADAVSAGFSVADARERVYRLRIE
jgi:DNA-binding MarR family transcriptional regulator